MPTTALPRNGAGERKNRCPSCDCRRTQNAFFQASNTPHYQAIDAQDAAPGDRDDESQQQGSLGSGSRVLPPDTNSTGRGIVACVSRLAFFKIMAKFLDTRDDRLDTRLDFLLRREPAE